MEADAWEKTPLADVAQQKIVYGIVQAGEHVDDGVPYIKSSDVGREIEPSSLSKTAKVIHQKYHRSRVVAGDIVFSLRGNTGATSIVPKELEEANLTQGTARITVSPSFDNRFVRFVLASDIAMRQVLAVAKGSTFTEVSLDALRKITIPHPPLPEQQKIADILSTWDRAIETTEALLATAQTQKRALMQSLLTGKRRFPEFEGQAWDEVRLGDILQISYGKSPKEILEFGGTNPVIGTGGVTGWTNSAIADGPAIVIGRKGTIDSPQWMEKPFWCIDTTYFCTTSDDNDLRWIFAWLGSINLKIFNEASGVPSLSRETLRSIKLRIPNRREQEALADVFVSCANEIGSLIEQITKLRAEKKALMQQLLTGKRRVVV